MQINWGQDTGTKTSGEILLPLDKYEVAITGVDVKLTKGATEYEKQDGTTGLTLDEALRTINPASKTGQPYGAMFVLSVKILRGLDTGAAHAEMKKQFNIWFNLKSDNIGLQQIKKICRAIGMSQLPKDTAEMHGKIFWLGVKIAPGAGEYGPKNEMSSAMSNDDIEEWAENNGKTIPDMFTAATDESAQQQNYLEDEDIPF